MTYSASALALVSPSRSQLEALLVSCSRKAWAETASVSRAYGIAYKSKMSGEALRANGNKVAAKPHVLAAYEGHKRTLDATARRIAESRHGVTIDRIMREFGHIGFSNILDYLHIGPEGRIFLDLDKATRDHMAAVQIVESDVLMVPAQDVVAAARVQAKRGQLLVPVLRLRLKLYSKHKALAAMGQHLGMF